MLSKSRNTESPRLNVDFLTPAKKGLNLDSIYEVFGRMANSSSMNPVETYGTWEHDGFASTLRRKTVDSRGRNVYLYVKKTFQGIQVSVYPAESVFAGTPKGALQICDVYSDSSARSNNEKTFTREQIVGEIKELIEAVEASKQR